MTKLLSEILDIDRPSFTHQINELERLAGRPGLDIRLSNEIKLLFKQKADSLGLDGDDTTAKELYFAMSHLVLDDSDRLAESIGISNQDTPEKMVEGAIEFVKKRTGGRFVWALKTNIARRQLKENPPKKLMKIYGIRSMDSALKRERPSLFYCFAGFIEPAGWLTKYGKQADKLTGSDFDNQNLYINTLAGIRRDQLAKARVNLNHIVYSDQESAGVEVAVPPRRFRGDVLFVVDTLLIHVRNIVRRSAYYKSLGLRPEFTDRIKNARLKGFNNLESYNYPFDWPTLVHAATQLGVTGLFHEQEPFISTEDLMVPSTAQMGGLNFWKHPFGFHAEPGIVVSFNLSDMIINAVNKIPVEKAYLANGRANLKNELFARYLAHERIRHEAFSLYGSEAGA